MRSIIIALLLVFACAPIWSQADLIYSKKGRPKKGKVWGTESGELTYNLFRTGIRKVTHGTIKLAADKVRKIVDDPHPHRQFWRRAAELKDGAADDWVELGHAAATNKLKGLAEHAFIEALVREPEHQGARKALGPGRCKALARTLPRLNAELKRKLGEYLQIGDGGERKLARKALVEIGCDLPDHYLERAVRSAKEKKGRTDDRILTLRSKEQKGKYTLCVPPSYDPLTPTPLVMGLHGGGRGGKDGKAVVGSGRSAMNFYEHGAERLGWIVACPTAVQAPWSAKPNLEFVMAVLDEIRVLFNVDENRIYLTGHSMGGYGTWAFGPRYAHLWAAISPMAGGGHNNLQALEKTLTGVYLYHGADDHVVGVGDSRAAGDEMLKKDMDFVYAEIPDSGHGFPREVAREMWAFFEVRRLAVTPRRTKKGKFKITQRPHSSFMARVTKEEKKYFGPLSTSETAAANADGQLKRLIKDLVSGGGLAEKAAPKIAALKSKAAVSAVGKILRNTRHAEDTRRFAARTLGELAFPDALKYLRKAVTQEEVSVVVAVFEALGRIPDKGNTVSFKKGAARLTSEFDRKKMGNRMRYSDFETYIEAAGRMVTAMASSDDRSVTPVINGLAREILLVSLDVPKLARAGHFPSRLRSKMARQLVAAYEKLQDPGSREVLDLLAARRDLGVEEDARKLLQSLQ